MKLRPILFIRRLFVLGLIFSLLLCGLRLLLYRGTATEKEPLPKTPIIDLHCHVAGMGIQGSGCFVAAGLKDSMKFPIYLRAFGVTEAELREVGDSILVSRLSTRIKQSKSIGSAVVLAMDGVITGGELDREKTQVFVPNSHVAKETKKYPNLLFGASVNPYRKDALARLDEVLAQGAVLLKWIPSIMDIDPADPRITPFYEKMRDAGLPLLTHTGQEKSFLEARDELCDPLRLELPLSLGVTVIAAHIATTGENEGEDNYERILPLFTKYKNLYADISSLTQVNKLGYLHRALLDDRLAGRLVYGSDWPLQFFPVVSPWYHALDLKVSQMWEISGIQNLWDRDVRLKQELGVPAGDFDRGRNLLRLP